MESIKQQLSAITQARYSCAPEACTDSQLYHALLALTQDLAANRPAPDRPQALLFLGRVFARQAAQQQSAGARPV